MQQGFLNRGIIESRELPPNTPRWDGARSSAGMAIRIGNALRRPFRRCPGSQATEVQIAGVLHNTRPIEGVQEDVVELLTPSRAWCSKLHNRRRRCSI